MNPFKSAKGFITLGIILLVTSIAYWIYFYTPFTNASGGDFANDIRCLITPCGFNLRHVPAYISIFFWIGIATIIIGSWFRGGRKYLSGPGILFLIIVTQVPFVVAIYFSFTNWNLLRPNSTGFMGWDRMWRNYSRVLNNPDFYSILWNTIFLTVSVVLLTFIFGMILALLLNRPFPGRAIARTLLISPFLVMPVAAGVLWKNILLNPTIGILTLILDFLNIPNFYLPDVTPMGSIILIVTWQWTPFVMLILLSGLQSLPDSTVEAARIDGAGGIGMFRFIILPHLKRFIEIALLLETIFILNVFGIIFIVTSGGPSIITTNLPYQIFLEAFSRWNVGRASAYGIFAVILANIVIILFLRVLGNKDETEAVA